MPTPRRALDAVEAPEAPAAPARHALSGVDDPTDFVADGAAHLEESERTGSRRRGGMAAVLALGCTATAIAAVQFTRNASDQQSQPSPSVTVTAPRQPVSRSQQRLPLGPAVASAVAVAVPPVAPSATPTPAAASSRSTRPAPSASAAPVRPSASPARPSATPSTTAAPARVTGVRYTTTVVNLRQAASTDAARLDTLPAGSTVSITDVVDQGWRQVRVAGRGGWVRDAYLSERRVSQPASTSASGQATASSGTSTGGTTSTHGTASSGAGTRGTASDGTQEGTCASYAVENGLVAAAIHVHRVVCANFPSITEFGGYRAGDQEHGTGHALDCMTSGEAGWELANWARAHASELGISQVIYAQHIWTTQRASEGWRPMSDRGDATANHFDHVHITVA